MRFSIFGLTISSSWGNGHATLWRGLLKALAARGHTVTFYEKDVPYYAETRDGWTAPTGVKLKLYDSLDDLSAHAHLDLSCADVAIVTSYCGEGSAVCQFVLESRACLKVFYDLDTPITLDAISSGAGVPYLPSNGLAAFDLVLSYTGGRALEELRTRLGARVVAPLYGWVDPEIHKPAQPRHEFRSELNYLGTYAADRQVALEELFVKTACVRADARFVIGGALYPDSFPWVNNIFFVRHLPPTLHSAFFCSARATLNITRQAMAVYGYCPSGRLFEAAACGVPILTDTWDGLESFFCPGTEILSVRTSQEVQDVLSLSDAELKRIAENARIRALENHTASARAIQLEQILNQVNSRDSSGIQPSSVTTV